jgi:hypothetical protein
MIMENARRHVAIKTDGYRWADIPWRGGEAERSSPTWLSLCWIEAVHTCR